MRMNNVGAPTVALAGSRGGDKYLSERFWDEE